ncbi:MAG: response regulator [Alphaproteobacteria bacterium]|nr:response regulator [Alphaproteobacteria bacterium]
MTTAEKQSMNVLLIEDNPGDVLLTQEGLKHAGVPTMLNVARDGEEALQYLRKGEGFAEAETPDLIFLDLNLPRVNGREVLEEIKKDPALHRIPVVVLTSSAAPNDIAAMYDRYANCYIVKPDGLEKYLQVVQSVNDFWLRTVSRAQSK